MLQVDSDISFLFLVADSNAAPTDKPLHATASSAAARPLSAAMNSQWQPPSWHHHHSRHAPPPSAAGAHLPSSYALPSPRHSRSLDSTPTNAEHSQRYESSYASEYNSYGHGGYHDHPRDGYYGADSQWYPEDHHGHHHGHHQHAESSYGKPSTDSMGIAIDPLPLRHLVVPPTVSNVNNGHNVDEELYEARMLQEALTTPQYPRAHLGGFHHQHPHHPPQHSQYSTPFVSAVLAASAPMHHHHSSHPGMHLARQSSAVTTPSEHTTPSDSEVHSGDANANSTTGKRKRRGESAPRLCRVEGCSKGIRSRGLCKAHGGGRRCMTPGCTTSDQGGGHCVLHGGGRRCTIEGCTKSAQWKGLCKMHGGARRCRYQNCTKNGQVKAGYCRAHHNLISKQREQEGIAA